MKKISLTIRQARILIKVACIADKEVRQAFFGHFTERPSGVIFIPKILQSSTKDTMHLSMGNYTVKLHQDSIEYKLLTAFSEAKSIGHFKVLLKKRLNWVWNHIFQTHFDEESDYLRKKELKLRRIEGGYKLSFGNLFLECISIEIAKHMWDNYETYWASCPISLEDLSRIYRVTK